ncbi:hypothetical protein LCGC14_1653490 [marine sediment metagenome]|uniref:Uncharacterized protein n=1 Tax=marine sediment metagenome TaxID=412755 RepID=A0A0F9HWW4_9ZZZZ
MGLLVNLWLSLQKRLIEWECNMKILVVIFLALIAFRLIDELLPITYSRPEPKTSPPTRRKRTGEYDGK